MTIGYWDDLGSGGILGKMVFDGASGCFGESVFVRFLVLVYPTPPPPVYLGKRGGRSGIYPDVGIISAQQN